ncbi:hypothetical protein F4802DRAFT_619400 [Xylaria palmicola]|nr:hypothetical protein F4802DRAFT_619400 [Xylaria palmicola]
MKLLQSTAVVFTLLLNLVAADEGTALAPPASDQNPIPDAQVWCTGKKLDIGQTSAAYNKLHTRCGLNKIKGGDLSIAQNQEAMWAVCNCWQLGGVYCPENEMDQANRMMDEECGVGWSGRVWSEKWQKFFIRERADLLWDTAYLRCGICPISCCKHRKP